MNNITFDSLSSSILSYASFFDKESDRIDLKIVMITLSLFGAVSILASKLLLKGRVAKQPVQPEPAPTPRFTFSIPPQERTLRWHPDGTIVHDEVAETVDQAKKYFQLHRSAHEFQMLNQPLNRSFFDCDARLTTVLHRITVAIFSEENLQNHLPMIRREIRETLTTFFSDEHSSEQFASLMQECCFHIIMEIFYGDRGSYEDFMEIQPKIRSHSDSEMIGNFLNSHINDDNNTQGIARLFARENLDEDQEDHCVAILMKVALALTSSGIANLVGRFMNDKSLAFRIALSLGQNSTSSNDFNQDLMKVIVEDFRLKPIESKIDRGRLKILIDKFARNADLVGPDPETFNPDRFDKLPTNWTALEWGPFGFYTHACPGWRLYKFVATQFFTQMLTPPDDEL